MSKKTRVLLLAEACNPEWQSVPLVGYNLYRALAEKANVTLVTQIRNKAAIQRHVPADFRIEFINSERVAAPFHRVSRWLTFGRGLGWTTKQASRWIPYLYFEKLVYRRFRDALNAGEFDIVHRITPVTPTLPSPIARWTDVPFVFGPINGGLPWPKGTTKTRLAEMEWLSYLRNLYRVLPYVRSTYKRAKCIFVGSKYTQSTIPASGRDNTVYLPENAVNLARFNAEGRRPPSEVKPFRAVFVGRFVPLKGIDMLLRAFADADLPKDSMVALIGDGPIRSDLESLAEELGIADRIEWPGWLPQNEIVKWFHRSSIFVLPSIKEFGGAVVLEAMACGLPCVVINYGGPGEYIDESTGVPIPLGSKDAMISSLRIALVELAKSPAKLDSMSQSCVETIQEHFTWSKKADRICSAYEQVLQSAGLASNGGGVKAEDKKVQVS